MIKGFREIPITKDSYPFASAEKYLELSSKGYVEKEFYMDGTANVYQSATNGITIKNHDVAYTNRIIVREPADSSKFSGHVFVEIINPTSMMEIDRMWILGYREFMRSNDIYIGITSKPATFGKLFEFNNDRYKEMSWPNPTKDIPFSFTFEDLMKAGALPDQDINSETGLFWDMLSDLGKVLKSNVNSPLAGYDVKHVSLTGWSQSACYMFRYINDFAFNNGDIYDGFLIGAPPRYCYIPVNQYETCSEGQFGWKKYVEKCHVPLIIMQTECENYGFGGEGIDRRNSDDPEYLCREYDITGASHDTQETYVDYYQNDEDLKRINHLPSYKTKNEVSNNYPSYFAFGAGYHNLKKWIETKVAPTTCSLIEVERNGLNKKDIFGNSVGGLRTCLLDYPTGAYYNYSDINKGDSLMFPDSDKEVLFGHEEPFSSAMLKELYGSLENYQKLCEKHTAKQINKGFIVKEDGKELVEFAVNLAKKRGL